MVPPPGDEVEAEMVPGSQRRMSSAPSIEVSFKCDVERIFSTETFNFSDDATNCGCG